MSSMQMPFLLALLIVPNVWTMILDIRYPQFFHLSTNDSAVEITEGKTAGSFIAFLTIINGTLDEWSMNCSHEDFQVIFNGISYSLITRESLDRERQAFYQLVITAEHQLYPYESISKSVRLRILDLNDSPPIFNQSSYRSKLIPHQSSYTVQAFDADQAETENSRISYSLANYQDLFRINETTGTIECVKHRYSDDRYELIVQARDHGKPSLSSSTLVQIELVAQSSSRSFPWHFFLEQRPENLLILIGVLAGIVLFICLFTCAICSMHYRWKRRVRSTATLSKSPSAGAPASIHLYLPENLNNSNNNDLIGCAWSSSDSSDQASNEYLLLNYPNLRSSASYV